MLQSEREALFNTVQEWQGYRDPVHLLRKRGTLGLFTFLPQGPCLLLRGWGSVKVGGRCPPLAGSAGYLTCYPVGAELPEAQRGLDPPQQGHHVQVLDPAPAGGHQTCAAGTPHLPPC